jgi:hypothetical protein
MRFDTGHSLSSLSAGGWTAVPLFPSIPFQNVPPQDAGQSARWFASRQKENGAPILTAFPSPQRWSRAARLPVSARQGLSSR